MAEADQEFTTAETLKEVNNAIYAVLVGGQSYKIGSRQLTRADLSLLRTMQNDLQAQLAQETQTGLLDDCYVAVFQGR